MIPLPPVLSWSLAILALFALFVCVYYAIFRKGFILQQLQAIIDSYPQKKKCADCWRFVFFMMQRKFNLWRKIIENFELFSIISSIVITILEHRDIISSPKWAADIQSAIESPNWLMQLQFVVLIAVSIYSIMIDQTLMAYELFKKQAAAS
jgi:hypothetical protein